MIHKKSWPWSGEGILKACEGLKACNPRPAKVLQGRGDRSGGCDHRSARATGVVRVASPFLRVTIFPQGTQYRCGPQCSPFSIFELSAGIFAARSWKFNTVGSVAWWKGLGHMAAQVLTHGWCITMYYSRRDCRSHWEVQGGERKWIMSPWNLAFLLSTLQGVKMVKSAMTWGFISHYEQPDYAGEASERWLDGLMAWWLGMVGPCWAVSSPAATCKASKFGQRGGGSRKEDSQGVNSHKAENLSEIEFHRHKTFRWMHRLHRVCVCVQVLGSLNGLPPFWDSVTASEFCGCIHRNMTWLDHRRPSSAFQAVFASILDSAPSLQSLFKTPKLVAAKFISGISAEPWGCRSILIQTVDLWSLYITVYRAVILRTWQDCCQSERFRKRVQLGAALGRIATWRVWSYCLESKEILWLIPKS